MIFALFSGTSTSVNTLLFQNDLIWYTQLSAQAAPVPSPPSGDIHLYLLAMGGGAPEEVFGTIDGVNIASLPGVIVSDDFSSSLSGYDLFSVTDGTYSVALADVQAAFANRNFQPPTPGCEYVCMNYGAFANHQSFLIGGNKAQLFAFPVPGPLPLAGVLAGLHASRRIRQRIRASRP